MRADSAGVWWLSLRRHGPARRDSGPRPGPPPRAGGQESTCSERVPQWSGSGQRLSPPTPRARGEVRELAIAPARRDCLPTLETSSASGASWRSDDDRDRSGRVRRGARGRPAGRGDRPADVGDGEVLVRVHAASVDRGTWHLMAGLPYPIRLAGFGLRRPKHSNPGRSLAGTVEAVGERRDRASRPATRCSASATARSPSTPCAAADKLAPKPANLSFEQAAAVPISGLTALQAVRDHGAVQAGQQVLIIGASGGVGTFAVQIAKAFGAEVTGVCSTAKVDMRPRPRRRPRRRLHPRRLRRRRAALRRHPRHRRQPPARRPPARPHPAGTARHRRRRDRRALARRHRPSAPGDAAVPVRRPEARHVRRVGERRGPGRLRELIEAGRSRPPSTGPTRSARSPRPSATCWTGAREARSSSRSGRDGFSSVGFRQLAAMPSSARRWSGLQRDTLGVFAVVGLVDRVLSSARHSSSARTLRGPLSRSGAWLP